MKMVTVNGSKAAHSARTPVKAAPARLTTGVVLAGGRSTRMGRDKAMLRFGGRRMLDHMIGVLAQSGVRSLCVSGTYAGYPCVPDDVPGRGPLQGIASVLKALPERRLVIVPVDMPRIAPACLRQLMRAHQGLCTHFEGHALPMVLESTEAVRRAVDQLLAKPGKSRHSLRALQALVDASVLNAGEALAQPELSLGNANTPQQWQQLTAEAQR